MEKKPSFKALGILALSILPLLTACGDTRAIPANDEFSSQLGEKDTRSGSSAPSGESADGSDMAGNSASTHNNSADQNSTGQNSADSALSKDTGVYRDGKYGASGHYGPISEDSIDVYVTVHDGVVSQLKVVGHPFTPVSRKHQDDFIDHINAKVIGKPLKNLKIDTVAGASWTSAAFNEALKVVRQEASQSAK